MFKLASFENELFESMQKKLVANQVESNKGFSKVAKAVELLTTAADIFDAADMTEEAEEITDILKSLVSNLK